MGLKKHLDVQRVILYDAEDGVDTFSSSRISDYRQPVSQRTTPQLIKDQMAASEGEAREKSSYDATGW